MSEQIPKLKGTNAAAVILAAGRGTRLGCVDIPKVMLSVGDKPIVAYTVETLERLGLTSSQICLVVGFRKEKVEEYFGDRVLFAHQTEQLGTAHAAYVGITALPSSIRQVLVLGGDDSAFYTEETLRNFLEAHKKSGSVLSLLTTEIEDPIGYGRIVRLPNGDIEIIEKEYLTAEQEIVKEISTGTFCFDRDWFEEIFPRMPKMRKLDEFGLPTAMAMARTEGQSYQVVKLEKNDEWFGINTPTELEEARKRKMNTTTFSLLSL